MLRNGLASNGFAVENDFADQLYAPRGRSMLFDRLSSYKPIGEIKDFMRSKPIFKNQKEKRSAVPICVIDDEPFLPHKNLSSYGYEITEIQDIKSIEEVSAYNIVLCDLMGVGKSFDTTLGGASIIKEIKINYPSKFVIAYTGARATATESRHAKEFADDFIKKDADLSEWSELLDGFVNLSVDPYEMWLIARHNLLELELDMRDVIKLEDAYVRSVLASDKQFNPLLKVLEGIPEDGTVKGIVQSLIASAIYGLLFGL